MKIGEFAKKNNTTIDTIRHYMNLKLLLPLKNGGQYDFDEICQSDFDEIYQLKRLKFTLKDIQYFLDYKRLSGISFTSFQANEHILSLYKAHLKHLIEEEKQLRNTIQTLKTSIQAPNPQPILKKRQIGIDIQLIQFIACPICSTHPLTLKANDVHNNMIFEGALTCKCGVSLKIHDGILFGQTYKDSKYAEHFSLSEYIQETDDQIIANIRQSKNWFDKQTPAHAFQDQLVLELGSGSGFFIRSALKRIDESKAYIAVDYDLSRHQYLKNLLEQSGSDVPIQFFCCEFNEIPLKKGVVDIFIDASGTSNYGFDHDHFLLDKILPLGNKNHQLFATYIVFKKFSLNNPAPLANRKLFNKEAIIENIIEKGYDIIAKGQGGAFNKESSYEDYFTKDDLVTNMWLYALLKENSS